MKKTLVLTLFAAILFLPSMGKAQSKETLIEQIKADYSWCRGMLADKFTTINVSKDCWAQLLNKDLTAQGAKWYAGLGYSIMYFAKYMGWGDLTDKDGTDYGDKEKQAEMEQIANQFKTKVSITLDAMEMPSKQNYYDLMMRYLSSIGDFIQDPPYQTRIEKWKPKSGEMHIKLVMSSKVKDIGVSTDGKNFVVAAPYLQEPVDWTTKLIKGLAKGGH
jgi:hypothetical protein